MGQWESKVYRRSECVCFRKTHAAFGGLSNMACALPLVVNGVRIRSAEALYQACRHPRRPDVQKELIEANSPWLAKVRSRKYLGQSREDWDEVKVRVMRWCLRVKLAANWSRFAGLLIRTEGRPVVEDSSRDDFWGAVPRDEEVLVGRNVLGRLLMELREDLLRPDAGALRRVEPLPLSEFLLYGKPIRAVQSWEVFGEGLVGPDLSPPASALWKLPTLGQEHRPD